MTRDSNISKESRPSRGRSVDNEYKGVWSSKTISVRVLFGSDSRILLFHSGNSWKSLNSKISNAFKINTAFDIFYKNLSNERLVPIKYAKAFFSFLEEEVSPCIYIKLKSSYRERWSDGFYETPERFRKQLSNSNYKPSKPPAEKRVYMTPNRFSKPLPFVSQAASPQEKTASSFFNNQLTPITPHSTNKKTARSDPTQQQNKNKPCNNFSSNTSRTNHPIEHNNYSLNTDNALSRLNDTLPSLDHFPPSSSHSQFLEKPKTGVSDPTLSNTTGLSRKVFPLNSDILIPPMVSKFAQTQVDYTSEAIQATSFSGSSRDSIGNKEESTLQIIETPTEPDSEGVLILSIVEKFQNALSNHSTIDILSELLLDQILNGSKVNLALLERSLQRFKILSESSLSKA